MEDASILELLRARQSEGLEQLLSRYSGLMHYVIGGILRHPQEVEDCYNEVCLCLWQKVDAYDPEKASLSTYLTAVSRNMALNRLKSLQRRSAHETEEEPSSASTPEDALVRKEQLEQLKALIGRMDHKDRQLFYRKYYYMQPMAQIAAEMGLSLRAAEGRLYRLRKRLQEGLGGEDYE